MRASDRFHVLNTRAELLNCHRQCKHSSLQPAPMTLRLASRRHKHKPSVKQPRIANGFAINTSSPNRRSSVFFSPLSCAAGGRADGGRGRLAARHLPRQQGLVPSELRREVRRPVDRQGASLVSGENVRPAAAHQQQVGRMLGRF